ncbi:MAG: universal stress protein [Chloroflexi bacterium]|nr:universal stress protein [Chloroflexota bacterium]
MGNCDFTHFYGGECCSGGWGTAVTLKQELTQDAIQNFRAARLRAELERVRAALSGHSADLLSYEEVRQKIKAKETSKRELRDIPLDAIVGSVGRYKDFTRRFLPRVDQDEQRWAKVFTFTDGMEGLPPIEVFQLGDVYFVRDGNHRVSVARELEASHIEAFVTLVETNVPLSPDLAPDNLIIKERYAQFLDRTRLDKSCPDLDLTMSAAGNYRVLEYQIGVHQHWLDAEKGQQATFAEAAADWYEKVYQPVVHMIRRRGVLRDFPKRTVTDLYVWVYKRRARLIERLGWDVEVETAVSDLISSQSRRPARIRQRLSERLKDVMTPDAIEDGPAPGAWRQSWLDSRREGRLFSHILVGVNGRADGWQALEQAIRVAKREQGHLYGLHVVANRAEVDSESALAVKAEFERRCRETAVPGELSVETGNIMRVITHRARWTDLVVVSLAHPPGDQPVDRLSSGFSQLLRRCPRPMLAVPHTWKKLDRLLLAYDGSPKAEEALFVSAYLAGHWHVPLTVATVLGKRVRSETAVRARAYLESQNIQANYIEKEGHPAEIILQTTKKQEIDLIIMGGYGHSPVMEIIVGSVVDEVLRTCNRPALICR